MERYKINQNATEILDLLFAGKSVLTFESKRSGKWFTYKITKSKKNDLYFVSVLNGTDNDNMYKYLGTIFDKKFFKLTKGSKITTTALSYITFDWCFRHLIGDSDLLEQINVYHSGHCCKCGRTLTTPESIANCIGPECAKMYHIHREKTINVKQTALSL